MSRGLEDPQDPQGHEVRPDPRDRLASTALTASMGTDDPLEPTPQRDALRTAR